MDVEAFRRAGHAAVDRIAEYYKSIEDRPVTALFEPGAISALVPKDPPNVGDDFDNVAREFDRVVLPGTTHWQHPSFFAYFPSTVSFEAIIGDMFASSVNNPGFNWSTSPSHTELEHVMMDWVATALGLDETFKTRSGKGQGIILSSASECVLTVAVAARERALRYEFARHLVALSSSAPTQNPVYGADGRPMPPQHRPAFALPTFETMPQSQRAEMTGRLVMYGSTQTHSLGKKAAMILGLEWRVLDASADDGWGLRGDTVRKALEEDTANGLIPFLIIATVGSTNTGATDNLEELLAVAADFPTLWVHVDAAWAGMYLALPECRSELFLDAINASAPTTDEVEPSLPGSPAMSEPAKTTVANSAANTLPNGSSRTSTNSSASRSSRRRGPPDPESFLQAAPGLAHSFCANPHKAGLVGMDCSTLFVRERKMLTDALNLTPPYLRTKHGEAGTATDFRNSQLFLGRRFRSLKLYFVLRSFGLDGIRSWLRRSIQLAELVESLVRSSDRFELLTARSLALVVFRLNPSKNARPGVAALDEEDLNLVNRELNAALQGKADIAITGTIVGERQCIRFSIGSPLTRQEHVRKAWKLIGECADEAMASTGVGRTDRPTATN